jgi:hypothetical protein
MRIQKCTDFKKFAFLRCLDDLHFKYILHKQSGSESRSKIKVKVGSGSGSEINNFGSTTLVHQPTAKLPTDLLGVTDSYPGLS